MLSFVPLVLLLVSNPPNSHGLYLTYSLVYFIYPETCGVRLEDMDALFGDATTALATPAARAETGSLMGGNSPEPSMDYRRGMIGSIGNGIPPSSAIPGLDIDPPTVSIKNGKPQYTEGEEGGQGVGGWIARIAGRNKGYSGSVKSGDYRPVDQEDE
jgi:hypothetical protein